MKITEYKLADLLTTLENGGRPAGGVSSIMSGVPSIGGEHLTADGGFDFSNVKYVPEDYFQKMRRGHIQHDDILVVKDGATTGKTSFVTENFPFKKAAVNEHVFILRANKEKTLSKFLFYFLFSPFGQKQILANYRGAAIGGINQSFIQNTIIPLPSLPEQERIVRLLDEAEQVQAARHRASERMGQFVSALFTEMFGDTEFNDKKWKTKFLNEVLSKIESGGSPVCLDRPVKEGEWGMLKLGALTSCNYDDTQNKTLPKDYKPRPDLEIKARDVLFSRKNTYELVAACVFVFETRPKLILSDLTFRLCIRDENELLPEYLWQVLIQPNKRKKIQNLATGSAANMPNISKAKLLTVDIPLPPLALQREFASRVAEARAVEELQIKSAERIKALWQSMLARAFGGEL